MVAVVSGFWTCAQLSLHTAWDAIPLGCLRAGGHRPDGADACPPMELYCFPRYALPAAGAARTGRDASWPDVLRVVSGGHGHPLGAGGEVDSRSSRRPGQRSASLGTCSGLAAGRRTGCFSPPRSPAVGRGHACHGTDAGRNQALRPTGACPGISAGAGPADDGALPLALGFQRGRFAGSPAPSDDSSSTDHPPSLRGDVRLRVGGLDLGKRLLQPQPLRQDLGERLQRCVPSCLKLGTLLSSTRA